jgi:APA family basic amino acid/polyamine antiporter
LKALAFLVLIVAAFIFGRGDALTTSATTSTSAVTITAVVLSLQSVIYTYDGWAGVIYFSEEVKHPGRDIPRALFGGVLSIAAIYLLVNVALLYVLPIAQIAGKEFAAGEAANVIFGVYGDTIFRCLTIVSMLSGINALHLMATRVVFAMSRDGLFTKKAAAVNEGGTPAVSLFLSALVAVLFIAFGQTFDVVITVLAFFFVANYILSFISLFVLRQREPEKPRPYRAWGYPVTPALALLGSLLFLAGAVAADTKNSLYALLLLAVSYPVFLLMKRLK